jgi:hypothetical protein
MKKVAMQIIKNTQLYYFLHEWVTKEEISKWEKMGKPVPPPHSVKQRFLREYSKKYALRTLVETGTYLGDMVEAMQPYFDRIYSIELSKNLYKKASKRFKGIDNINLICGDSGIELKRIMNEINEPTLFWLDGHYSAGITARGEKDTPIYEELNHILSAKNKGHVIIIDDARCFGTESTYPTVEKLCDFIKSKRSNLNITVQDDSIRITPK